jgi:hypothetical protein
MSRRIIYVLWFGRIKVVCCKIKVESTYMRLFSLQITTALYLMTLRSRKAEACEKGQKQIQKFFD